MGLTIHYTINAPANWTPETIRTKLEAARQFAKGLPVVSVSEMAEFDGPEADFQHIRDTGREEQDDFFWAKIQSQRHLLNPWMPGCFGSQSPNRLILFSVLPAEGCEQMNIGSCSYPQHVWPASADRMSRPAWSQVFGDRNHDPESRKVMRAFMRRWNLTKLARSRKGVFRSDRFGGSKGLGYFAPYGKASAGIQRGRYRSHRRGYAGEFGLVIFEDQMEGELYLKHRGTAEEAEAVFANPEFRADVNRMIGGEDFLTPAASGRWSSFCKTQYANDPELGGTANFIKGHLSVLAILEHLQKLGFDVKVRDESDFWKNRNVEALAKTVGEWDTGLAAMFGAIKDAAGGQGMTVESPMSGRSDFEQLEMKGQGQIAKWVKAMPTPSAGEPHV